MPKRPNAQTPICPNAQTPIRPNAHTPKRPMRGNVSTKMETNVHGVVCFQSCNDYPLHCTMTIDSSWLAGMKCNAPDAFTTHAPFAPQGVFIDGQIRLMCPTSVAQTLTWDQYVSNQFE